MAAASIWSCPVIAADIDPVAVDVTDANLAANGLADRVETLVAPGFEHDRLTGPFDLVLANILKGPLLELAPSMASAMSENGHAVLSGLLTDQAEDVISHYEQAGFKLLQREDIVDWTTLILSLNGPNSLEF